MKRFRISNKFLTVAIKVMQVIVLLLLATKGIIDACHGEYASATWLIVLALLIPCSEILERQRRHHKHTVGKTDRDD